MDQTLVDTELDGRLAALGSFNETSAAKRLKFAQRASLLFLWNFRDWDFKNSTTTIATTQGNKGPYDGPSGLVRFASVQDLAVFGFDSGQRLRPIQSTSSKDWTPYIKIQDGKVYFFEDPGSNTLTLNYIGEFDNDIDNIATTTALFDEGLFSAHVNYCYGDIIQMLPGMFQEGQQYKEVARREALEYWEDKTQGQYQSVVTPHGVNGGRIDNHALIIHVLGTRQVLTDDG